MKSSSSYQIVLGLTYYSIFNFFIHYICFIKIENLIYSTFLHYYRKLTNIMNTFEFRFVNLLGEQVIVCNQTGYVNVSEFCNRYNKLFANWFITEHAQMFMREISITDNIPISHLLYTYALGCPKTNGIYVHKDIMIQVMNWCHPMFTRRVNKKVGNWCELGDFDIDIVEENPNDYRYVSLIHIPGDNYIFGYGSSDHVDQYTSLIANARQVVKIRTSPFHTLNDFIDVQLAFCCIKCDELGYKLIDVDERGFMDRMIEWFSV